MPGQARRGTRATGRSSRGDRSWPVVAAVSAADHGSPTSASLAIVPATPRLDLGTRATYQSLLRRGLAPAEAANLTAFLFGIHAGEMPWTLREVNRILFLRELNRLGRFGDEDGGPAEPN